MIKVLVTGANGLLANNTINALIDNGYFVRALVRNKNNFKLYNPNNVEVIEGDITQYSSVENAVKGCDFVVHAAAETNQGLKNYNDYAKINVEGTKTIFNAAINNGVKKIIHVSTCNVFGYGTIEKPGNEETNTSELFSSSLYVKSKIDAQKEALSFSEKIDVVIVNPTFMIGAFDQKPGSGRIVLMGYNKKIIFYPPGGKNFVDVKDVADGIVKAILKGKNKETFILSGENLSYKDFFNKLAKYSDTNPLLIKIPSIVLISVGIIGTFFKTIGFANEATLINMRILCIKNYYSNQNARHALSINFNGIDNAIQDAIKWFKSNGFIKS